MMDKNMIKTKNITNKICTVKIFLAGKYIWYLVITVLPLVDRYEMRDIILRA